MICLILISQRITFASIRRERVRALLLCVWESYFKYFFGIQLVWLHGAVICIMNEVGTGVIEGCQQKCFTFLSSLATRFVWVYLSLFSDVGHDAQMKTSQPVIK